MPGQFHGFRLYTIDDKLRVCLPVGLENSLKWFRPREEQECLAVPAAGGLVVFPPEALEEHRAMMARLENDNPRPSDIGTPAYQLARFGTLTWAVTISKGRLVLPQEARELGIVPGEPGAVVGIAVVRGALEIWRPSELRTLMEASTEQWGALRAKGLRGLGEEG